MAEPGQASAENALASDTTREESDRLLVASRRGLLVLLAIVLPLSLPGCFGLTAGAAVGIIAATSGSDGGGNSPAVVSGVEVEREHARKSPARIKFVLTDAEGDPVDVEIVYTDPESGRPNPVLLVGDNTELHGLLATPSGETHTREWNFAAQIGEGYTENLTVSVRIPRGTTASLAGVAVGNDPATVVAVGTPSGTANEEGALVGIVGIEFTVADSSDDLVSIEVQYCIGDEAVDPESPDWKTARPALVPEGVATPPFALTDVRAHRQGSVLSFFWDVVESFELDGVAELSVDVRLRFRANDGVDDGTWFPPQPRLFRVDNNSDPQVEFEDLAVSPDNAYDIPIRFVVRDEESHPVSVMLQWALEDQSFPEIRDRQGNVIPLDDPSAHLNHDQLDYLCDLVKDQKLADARRDYHVLAEAPVILRGVIDAYLPPDRIRETDFVRQGLLFLPPTRKSPRPLSGNTCREDSGVFLVGRKIRLFSAPGAPGRAIDLSREIDSFDPRTSTATLSHPPEVELPPGTLYELTANESPVKLASSREGLLHVFVWDSRADLKESGTPFNTTVRLRAVAFDSEVTTAIESLRVESDVLVPSATLITEEYPHAVAIGDVNNDNRNDVVLTNMWADSAGVYLQSPFGDLGLSAGTDARFEPNLMLETNEGPFCVALADVTGDCRNDVLVANRGTSTVGIYVQNDDCVLGTCEIERQANGAVVNLTRPVLGIAVGHLTPEGCTDDCTGMVAVANRGGRSVFFYRQVTPDANCVEGLEDPPGTRCCVPGIRTQSLSAETPYWVAIGDLDSDGRNDIVVTDEDPGEARVYFQVDADPDPDKLFREPMVLRTGARPLCVAVGDLNFDGKDDVVVANSGSSTVSLYFQRCQPECGLDPERTDYPTSGDPYAVAIGDVNGDGFNDFAVVNQALSTAEVYFQGPPEAFSRTTLLTLGTGMPANGVAIGDVNDDDHQDVVVTSGMAGRSLGNAIVYLQSPLGAFSPRAPRTYITGGEPSSAAIGDLNGDGRADFVVASRDVATLNELLPGTVSVFLQETTGLFPATPSHDVRLEGKPTSVAIGDVNGDGKNDILVAVEGEPMGTLGVILQTDSGGLEVIDPMLTGGGVCSIAVADLNGDGRNDVVVASERDRTTRVYFQGAGGISPVPLVLSTGRNTRAVATGDLNGDGLDDLAVANQAPGRARVYFQRGRETPHPALAARLDAFSSLALNGLDAVSEQDGGAGALRDFTPRVAPGSAAGGLPDLPDVVLETEGFPEAIAIGDLSGDGLSDVVLVGDVASCVYFQDDDGRFAGRLDLAFSETNPLPLAVAIGDVTGDRQNDIVVANNRHDTVSIFPGPLGVETGDLATAVRPAVSFPTRGSPTWVVVGDLTGDGRGGILVANEDERSVEVHLGR